MADRLEQVRASYAAFESGDPTALEQMLADDFTFYSPPDPGIDLAAYWARCWPNAGQIQGFEFVRLFEHDDEVVVTYECTRADGGRFRNTEVFTFDGDKIAQVEVYFGWNLD